MKQGAPGLHVGTPTSRSRIASSRRGLLPYGDRKRALGARGLGPTMHRILLLLALLPGAAAACGGLFCGGSLTVQSGERILFEVPGDGTISVTVGIQYFGDPDEFSWVVPVSETPDLTVTHPGFLALLDAATQPVITYPDATCIPGNCEACDGAGTEDSSGATSDVHVLDLEPVGPYEPEVISSDDAGALTDWLEANDYRVTSAMEPMIAEYVASGMKFLGLKLTPGTNPGNIAPLRMTYSGTVPTVPLRLTAVAADNDTPITVLVAGSGTYVAGNWPGFRVDPTNVRASTYSGATNYSALVRWRVNQRGGRAWVTEMAGPSRRVLDELEELNLDGQDGFDEVEELVGRHAYITRFFTHISPWEMTSDPTFVLGPNAELGRDIDLSGRATQDYCGTGYGDPVLAECSMTYCGPGDCVSWLDPLDVEEGWNIPSTGCACPDGWAATGGAAGATCARIDADSVGGDPCASNPQICGESGVCVGINGRAACVCSPGEAWVGGECRTGFTRYQPEQLLADIPADVRSDCSSCSSDASAAWLLLLLPMGLRRRV